MKKLRLSPHVVMIVSGSVLLGACNGPGGGSTAGSTINWDGGCAIVNDVDPPPAPHAEEGDRFCVRLDAGDWSFEPGAGMPNWAPVGGSPGDPIPMTVVTLAGGVGIWQFDVDVTDHVPQSASPPPPQNHGRLHQGDFKYQLQIMFSNNIPGMTTIRIPGLPGNILHGGTAHASFD